jgi:hypothetical protein
VVTVEIAVANGHVLLLFRVPDDNADVVVVMTPDEAREFSNGIGGAIQCASKAGVLT